MTARSHAPGPPSPAPGACQRRAFQDHRRWSENVNVKPTQHKLANASSHWTGKPPTDPRGPVTVSTTARGPQRDRARDTTPRQAMSLRVPDDLMSDLQLYRALTGINANRLIVNLLTEFFEGSGRKEITEAMTQRARERYGVALSELAEQ